MTIMSYLDVIIDAEMFVDNGIVYIVTLSALHHGKFQEFVPLFQGLFLLYLLDFSRFIDLVLGTDDWAFKEKFLLDSSSFSL